MASGDLIERAGKPARLGLGMVVLALAAVLPGHAMAAPPATSPTFLTQGDVTLPDRSRLIDSIDAVDGCGEAPKGGPIEVDGHAADWRATPTMIPGTGRIDHGEYVWTDFPYDDDGTGSFQYPGEGEAPVAVAGTIGKGSALEQRYGSNAADVVELQATADQRFVYLLVRFNFLNAVDSTAVGFAFDTRQDSGSGTWPLGAQVSTPGADTFVTAYGKCAFVDTPAGQQRIDAIGGAIRVGTRDNVFELALPRSVLGDAKALRMAAGAGLWDPAAGRWMVSSMTPAAGANNSATPRGAKSASDPAIFNLLFRDDESTTASPPVVVVQPGSPRTFETARQHAVLSMGTTGGYAATLDFSKLGHAKASTPIPTRPNRDLDFVRVYRSRIDAEGVLVDSGGGTTSMFFGRYEPYATYLPRCFDHGRCGWPTGRPPLVEFLHGGGVDHLGQAPEPSIAEGGTNLYGARSVYTANAADHAIVIRPLGRGQRPPWWRGLGEADALEAMQATRDAYHTDPDHQLITGGSLGGYGTIRLGGLYPDLWSGAFAHCPVEYEDSNSAKRAQGNAAPSTQTFLIDPVLASMINVPYVQASGVADPLAPILADRRLRDTALADGLSLRYTEYQAGSHCFDGAEGGYPWVANHHREQSSLLGHARDADPARVHYAIDPRQYPAAPENIGVFDVRDLGIRYQGAYWVSGLQVRPDDEQAAQASGATDSVVASIDVTDRSRPGWQITTSDCGSGTGTTSTDGGNPELDPRNPTPHTWLCQAQVRGGAPDRQLDVAEHQFQAATMDLRRSPLGGDGSFTAVVAGDGPFHLTLSGISATATGDCLAAGGPTPGGTELDLNLGSAPCTLNLVAQETP